MKGYRAADPPLLLIEDNPTDAALIQTLLRGDGDAVRWVDRLSSGLEIIHSQPVSEVLVDLNLPDSSGMNTLTTIRSAAPAVPVVVITGADDPGWAREALLAGAIDYLVKGNFDADALMRAVRQAREQRHAERNSIFVENRYRAVVDALQEGLAVLDENGVLTFVNDQLADYLQRPPGDLLGASIFELVDARNATIIRHHLERRRAGRKDRYDLSIVRPDGRAVVFSISTSPLFNADGSFAGSAATLIDKTQQSARAGAQYGAEEHFRAMVEHALVGVFMTVGTAFSYVNPELAGMLGYSQDEMIGRECLEFVLPEDHHLTDPDAVTNEPRLVRFFRKDRTVAVLQLQITETDLPGRRSCVGTARDVSAASLDLERKNRLAAIVESTDDAIITCDLHGLILTWNRGAEKLLGYSREEMIGHRTVRDLVPEDLIAETDRIIESVMGSQRIEHFETRRRAKDGDIVAVSLSVSPIHDESGAVTTLSSIMRDVTAQKTAERQLEQNTRLSSLGRMATEIAHEFNNVLMGIQPFAEVIERTSKDEDILKAASQIRRSVRRGKAVAEDILSFNNPKPPELEPLAVASWLETTIEPELRAILNGKIDLIVDVTPPDLYVMADPSQLAQVLVNLTVNAKHAMPKGGRFSIRVRRCGAGERFAFGVLPLSERFVHFEITDTGSGMDQATLDRVFEPRFTTKKSGSGLGLPLTHQILQRHGGHVFVESTPGAGTAFHFFLVVADPENCTRHDAAAVSAPMRRPRRVLIVDDEMEIALGLKELLALEGIESEVIYTAQAAIPAIERFAPDVLVLDVTLGEASGFDVYTTIAERWPDLGVIFSTGHATEEHLEPLPRARYVALLRKPYDFARLLMELGKAMM